MSQPDESQTANGSVVKTFTCNLCEALCGMHVTVEGGTRITKIRGNPDDVFSKGHICPKGPAMREVFHDPDRLRQPMRKTANGFEPIDWETALSEVAARTREIQRKHGRDAIALYVGNPAVHGHRASLGAQILTLALHTKNHYDANSQDSNPRLFAAMQVYGDALAMPVPDVDRTDYFLMLGANPAASNGSQMVLGDVRTRLSSIKARGGQVVLIDPRRNESMAFCTEHHFIRPGGDAAFLLALMHVLFTERLIDIPGVRELATGVRQIEAIAMRFSPERVERSVGIAAAQIRHVARALAKAKRAAVYGRIGTCQNEFGPVANWLVEALNLLTCNFDREGGVLFPTPPADIGPLGRLLVGNNVGRWHSRVRGLPEFLGSLPSAVMAEEMETPGPGQIRALFTYAGNPVLSTPNGPRLEKAIAKLDLSVSFDFYVNETNRLADYILPPAHIFEAGNFDVILLRFAVRQVAKYSPPIMPKGPETKDDWEIASAFAARVVLGDRPWLVRLAERMLKNLPEKAVDWLLRLGPFDLTLQKLADTQEGIDLGPLVPRRRDVVHTVDGRARLAPPAFVADIPRLEAWVDAPTDSTLSLIGRRHLRSNNSWMHNVPSLVKGPDRSQLLMHPEDARALGLKEGSQVKITSRVGEAQTTLLLSADMMKGVVSLPHGYGHADLRGSTNVAAATKGPSANVLTDEALVEPILGTSILNGVRVTVTAV